MTDLLKSPNDEAEYCSYTEEEQREIERERMAGMCDPGAWEAYLKAESEGKDPNKALAAWYAGEEVD